VLVRVRKKVQEVSWTLGGKGDYVPFTETPFSEHVLATYWFAGVMRSHGPAEPGQPGHADLGELMDAELNPKELLERIVQLKEHL
jgi:hypothetical protein